MGLGNYYIIQIKYPSRFGRWFYLLYYSCIQTFAAKHKTSVKDIMKTYGYFDFSNPKINTKKPNATDLRIITHYTFNKTKKYSTLLNSKEIMFQLSKLKNKYVEEKVNNQLHELVKEAAMFNQFQNSVQRNFILCNLWKKKG